MGSFSAISDVGETLKTLLQNGMDTTFGTDVISVMLDSPNKIEKDNMTDDKILSVFLLRVVENNDAKNQLPHPISSTEIAPKPLVLDLYYMITAYGADDNNRSRILGRGMQILFENPLLQGAALQSQLEGTLDKIRITLNPMTQEMITQIWQGMESSLRVSAFYLISPVIIESAPVPVAERVKERLLSES